MLRVVLINILLLLLPVAIYVGYVTFKKPGTDPNDMWRDAPLLGLFGAGTALVIVVMVFFVSFTGGPREGTYVPAEVRDGKLVPGHVEHE